MNWKQMSLIGGALFTMLFGAGNIIFPLILGRALGTSTPYAMFGFLLTGVLLPLLGFISIMLVKGDYVIFLKSLGKIPAFIIASLCMILLGPIGAIPRCIALAHADLAWYFPSLSIFVFSIFAACLLALCTFKTSNMMDIIGRFLGPIKILSLISIAIVGVLVSGEAEIGQQSATQSFSQGMLSGYGTLDLLAVLFFSQFIFTLLVPEGKNIEQKELLKRTFFVSAIAGTLMCIVYIGFSIAAVLHGSKLNGIADDTLLSALASTVLGAKSGIFANITIAITCLTSAIALTASFADFLSRFVFKERISYKTALFITISLSAIFANLRFAGIMKTILPAINLLYPALVVFAALHLFLIFVQKHSSKLARNAFFLTLAASVLLDLLD